MEIKYRKDLINYFVKIFDYNSYLEIGVRDKSITFDKINVNFKEGVDVYPPADYVMESDIFFEKYAGNKKWDIILVDGDHERSQAKRDILNSLNHLNENGTIVVHDVNPYSIDKLNPTICHNAWEAFAELRCEREDLEMHTIPVNYLGFIRKGKQKTWHHLEERTFEYLDNNRKELMNEITVDELKEKFCKTV
tara:strand:- start:93 stop:671 length:579 start_codon:yes stop_codon:yes gene_type:complete